MSYEVQYHKIQNTREYAEKLLRPKDEVMAQGVATPPQERKKTMLPKDIEAFKAYESFLGAYGDSSELDPIFFEYDIVIQTNSTLPMDKQSLANMSMRLFQTKAIDQEALLDTLQYPNKDEILRRMKQQEGGQNATKPKPGNARPNPSQPVSP